MTGRDLYRKQSFRILLEQMAAGSIMADDLGTKAYDAATALLAMVGAVRARTEVRCDLYHVGLSARFSSVIAPFVEPEERSTLNSIYGETEVEKFMGAIAPLHADAIEIRCATMREYRPPTASEWRRLKEIGGEYDVAAATLERTVAKIN